ncbi:sarcosine dehydrogenase, mitochondrial [Copidosoma floridanum]|uniref:sarcosine dehydrogenase, mitochondrial n=1 Tax=Copidosoma floridanum TaxID=29053 RepID=UPI0006C9B7AE|nr:sarcosine dehydrogenase, mitochondrial [Copidosoma floridanum]XP_014204462.1 sarcosine dehydrogenase, mitochondrial [Copidosoma floridanum]XP_014204463.1 sarcosine dehydrogenase, mitochondrial [Copidosoma floridanum]
MGRGSRAQQFASLITSRADEMLRAATVKLTGRWNGRWSQVKSASSEAVVKKPEPSIDLPESADVVVIGGGVAGCSALYQLAKQGLRAVLLERSKLTSGTTWHTAGMVWSLRPSEIEIQLLRATQDTIAELENETGDNVGWTNNGGLFIAHNDVRMDEYRRLVDMGKVLGVGARLITPHEARDLFPLLDPAAFRGAIHSPRDGSLDPAMLTAALSKCARSRGAKLVENCPVTRILTDERTFGSRRVKGVETEHGIVRTSCVLVASGAWSRSIARMAKLDVPLVPMKHAYIVTEPIPGAVTRGAPNVRDHDYNIYMKVQAETLQIGGYEANPIILRCVPRDFNFGLYELDWNVFNAHLESMVKIVPELATTGIKSTVCGPESFTPDHKPIMGEDPRCSGFFYSCGYNSAGMMYSGGCGQTIADWIVNGRPKDHVFPYDIRRFTPEQASDMVWANERSHEAYVKNYSIVFPNDQPLGGRNFKTSSFHDFLVKEGAVMEERQGWERPGWFLKDGTAPVQPYDYYGSYGTTKNPKNRYADVLAQDHTFDYPAHHDIIQEEALACRNNAVLFDMSYFGKFYLCGPDVQLVADYLFTAKTDSDVDRIVYTCMLNERGGIEGDCTVTWILPGSSGVADPIFKGKALYVVSGGLSSYHTWAHIRRAIAKKGFNVSLHDATHQMGILSLQGPNSQKILQNVVDSDISDEAFPFSTSKLMRANGKLVRAFRISFVGELGYELHIPLQSCEKVYHGLVEQGKQMDFKLAGYRALYGLSCEKGYHLWNADLRSDDNPIEANLGFTCRKDGGYLGSEAVENLRKNGVKRKFAILHVKDKVPLWGMETVYRNKEIVGYLRRAEYAPHFGYSIGHAYVNHPNDDIVTNEFLESGEYEVEVLGKMHPAEIYLKSPFDPQNKRLLNHYDQL